MKKSSKKSTKITQTRAVIMLSYQKILKFLRGIDRKSGIYVAALTVSVLMLLATSVYAGRHASDDYSTNSNAHMLTHLFSGHTNYPVVLPGPHATLLIIPVVYIQGHLPYHYTSFTLVNIGLVVATMLGWSLLMIKLFGRKYEIPIIIILSSLIFTSVAFSYSLAYTTIRNIEYPLVLWFVMIVAAVLKGGNFSRKQLVWGATGSILFVITLAGDSFFNYAILLPLLVVIGWYWMQSRQFTTNMLKALGLVFGSFVAATLLKAALSAAGLIIFDYGFWGPNTILTTDKLWPSVGVALKETLDMHGANVFGQIINYHNVAVFLNFVLLIVGVGSLVAILLKANHGFRRKKGLAEPTNFVLVVMAVSFFVSFIIFAVSGYSIATLSNGRIVSAENARYISILPLVTVLAIIWLLKSYYSKYTALVCVLCVALVAGIVTSYPGIKQAYASGNHKLEISASRDSINQTITHLKNNNVTEVSADYWYGHVIRFWSNNTIKVGAIANCDESQLTKPDSLFTKQNHNTALIIDRGERNYGFWKCTDDELIRVYGMPNEAYEVPGAGPNEPVKIWIYKKAP